MRWKAGFRSAGILPAFFWMLDEQNCRLDAGATKPVASRQIL
jgi:hypothetical protein